jgi:hypothetical protein
MLLLFGIVISMANTRRRVCIDGDSLDGVTQLGTKMGAVRELFQLFTFAIEQLIPSFS